MVDQSGTQWSSAGPERYVVESQYDNMGRLVKKVSRDSSNDDDSIRWEASYEYDGKGRMVREKILRQDLLAGRMIVTQDIKTTYDLGGNATEIDFYDDSGHAYTETRTYSQGYQLNGATFSNAGAGVNVITAGSYTYDANNNMTGSMSVSVSRGMVQLAYRGQWTFTYDHLNRLKSHTNTNAGGLRTNLWYNPMGQVWQRWTDISGNWTPSLTRYVYDGGMLVQEHSWSQTHPSGSYIYTYGYLSRDYLMQPGGVRQKESSDGVNSTDRFLITDGGVITTSIDRQTSTTIKRIELAKSGDRQAGGSQQDGKLSNLFSVGSYLEGYGGGTSGNSAGFDPLVGKENYCSSGSGCQPEMPDPNPYPRFQPCYIFSFPPYIGPKLSTYQLICCCTPNFISYEDPPQITTGVGVDNYSVQMGNCTCSANCECTRENHTYHWTPTIACPWNINCTYPLCKEYIAQRDESYYSHCNETNETRSSDDLSCKSICAYYFTLWGISCTAHNSEITNCIDTIMPCLDCVGGRVIKPGGGPTPIGPGPTPIGSGIGLAI